MGAIASRIRKRKKKHTARREGKAEYEGQKRDSSSGYDVSGLEKERKCKYPGYCRSSERHFVRTKIDGIDFYHDSRYTLMRLLGSGAYGQVASARDCVTGRKVAVKRLDRLLDDPIDAKRILREIKILRHLKSHGNIVKLVDIFIEPSEKFNCLYIVFELMRSDLRKIIQSKNKLEKLHHQYMTYQLLCGIKYMHSANIWHRDLKPANLLVNANSKLKICDFGLARGFDERFDEEEVTDYVVTRWYRAPEIMVCDTYNEKIDVWAVGCILAELYKRKPVFRGVDSRDQVTKYLRLLGTPKPEDLAFITNNHAKRFVRSQIIRKNIPTSSQLSFIAQDIPEDALDLMTKMLEFNPEKRISIDEALAHPFYNRVRKKKHEIICEEKFNYSFEQRLNSENALRREFLIEARKFDVQSPI